MRTWIFTRHNGLRYPADSRKVGPLVNRIVSLHFESFLEEASSTYCIDEGANVSRMDSTVIVGVGFGVGVWGLRFGSGVERPFLVLKKTRCTRSDAVMHSCRFYADCGVNFSGFKQLCFSFYYLRKEGRSCTAVWSLSIIGFKLFNGIIIVRLFSSLLVIFIQISFIYAQSLLELFC